MNESEVMGCLPLAGYLGSRCWGIPAEDAKQEAVLGLVKAAQGFDPARGVKFTTFARKVIKNHLQDVAPDYQTYCELDGDPADEITEAVRGEEFVALRRAMKVLTPEVRQALEMRFGEDATYPEIAVKLGCGTRMAAAMVAAGLAKLRRMMAE